MIGNKIAEKITTVSNKKSVKELRNDGKKEERQQIIDELRLLPKKDAYF